ncbi:DNA gyrase inhibitor YacG [Massilia sp. W12]|uniref:DNA gyrase inhibitor YacG n=1 Tax=Massilia sp. W12 TaxID=3126507 RepID=UPI0030D1C143
MPTTVNCPRCAASVVWSSDSPWRPFCSERCKLADLGAWANEEYRISKTAQEADPEAAPPGPAQH